MTTAADRVSQEHSESDAPVDDRRVSQALSTYIADLRAAEGSAVESVHLFGSRARGDHRADSDVDVLVVYRDANDPEWVRLRRLSGLAFDVLLDTGVHIQPHPVSLGAWRAAEPSAFIRRVRRDARPLS